MSRCSLTFDDRGEFIVRAGPRDTDLVREIGGLRHDSRAGYWRGPAIWGTALKLRATFGEELEVSPEVDEWGWAQVQKERTAHHLKAGTYRSGLSTFEWAENLLDFQVDSVALMSEMNTVLNADEMGAGKTVQAAVALKRAGVDSLPALIICTSSMLDTWAQEVEKWCPGVEVVVVRGSAAKRRKLIEEAHYLGTPVVLVMTWGALRTHTRLAGYGSISLKRCTTCDPRDGDPLLKESGCEVHKRELNGGWIRTVIADEAHKAKDPKAKQTRALWAVGQEADNRWPLTGTPIASQEEDLWALLHFVDPQAWPSKTHFINRYTISTSGSWGLEVFGFNPATKPELDRLMAPYFICRPKSEILASLPPVLYSERWVEMEGKQLKAYDSMKKHMLLHNEGDILVAPDPLVKLTRLRQIACGTPVIETDADGEPQVVGLTEPSCKTEALLDIIDEMAGKSLVVFAESKLLLRHVSDVLTLKKIGHVQITGDVDSAQRAANIAAFQAGEVPVILVSLGAGAEGITLTRADTAVFLQRSYRMVANRQAEARIHRHGQVAESVQIIDIVTKDSIESEVHEVAQDKEEVLNQITKDPAWVRRVLKGDK